MCLCNVIVLCFSSISVCLPTAIFYCLFGIEPPVWIPDVHSNSCSSCTETFTFIRRRHHCRNCGKVPHPCPNAEYLCVKSHVFSCSVVTAPRTSSVCLTLATRRQYECVIPAANILFSRVASSIMYFGYSGCQESNSFFSTVIFYGQFY